MACLIGKYMKVLRSFRGEDFCRFIAEHERLYADARRRNDHAEATAWYYSLMAPLIETVYGTSWHFCPPDHPRQSREEAIASLHQRIARMIQLHAGRVAIDVGCGVGGAMRDMAVYSGACVTGVSVGREEIARNNALSVQQGVARLCNAVCADAQSMPFADESFDCGYAIYSLKYFGDVSRVLGEVHRVLKPGGLFASYNIVRTGSYDPSDEKQRRAVEFFEYACAMPPLLSESELAEAGQRCGLACVASMDISRPGAKWDHFFRADPLLPVVVRSRLARRLTAIAEKCRLLPRGFARFNEIFLAGTMAALLEAGALGAITGSNITVWRK
jgi:sterol 24-C-methyltransferase